MILVFLSMFGVMFLITQYFQLVLGYSPLAAALRLLPMAPIMMIVSPLTPRIVARLGANRTVATGMSLVAIGFLLFSFLGVDTPYAYVLAVRVLPRERHRADDVADDRRDHVGRAAAPRRRRLGDERRHPRARRRARRRRARQRRRLALQRRHRRRHRRICPRPTRPRARTSLGSALQAASHLPSDVAARLSSAADQAFVSGLHWAALTGAVLAACAAFLVHRFLPHHIAQHGALESAASSAEDVAELALAGVPPVFADTEPKSHSNRDRSVSA